MILRSSRLRADSGVGGQSVVVGDRDRDRRRGRCEHVAHGRSTLAGAQQDADGGGVDFRVAVLVVDDRDDRDDR
jgi:hypothetical protein